MTRFFLRGFLIVALTTANVRFVAQAQFIPAFICAFFLSAVWWGNARAAQGTAPWSREVYALGAACGTVAGIWAGGLL